MWYEKPVHGKMLLKCCQAKREGMIDGATPEAQVQAWILPQTLCFHSRIDEEKDEKCDSEVNSRFAGQML